MTRTEKLTKIKAFTSCSPIFLMNKVALSVGESDIFVDSGIYNDFEGDWCFVSGYDDLADSDVDKVFSALLQYASEVLTSFDD